MLKSIVIPALLTLMPLGDSWLTDAPVASSSQQARHMLPTSISGAPDQDGGWNLTFTFGPKSALGPEDRISLVGSFNHWNRLSDPMQLTADGSWTAGLTLPDGTYWYKFVANEDEWYPDPMNPDREPDGHGGQNTVLRLGAQANLDPALARIGDGRIEGLGLGHDPTRALYRQTQSDGVSRMRFRTLRDDVQSVSLIRPDSDPVELHPLLTDERFQWWEAVVSNSESPIPYTFIVQDATTRERYPDIHTMTDTEQSPFVTPDWARDAIWYQIMVDRFRNGTARNDPDPTRPWNSAWYEPSPWEGVDGQTFYEFFVFDRRYGGDLQGLIEKLDYLKDLGVNALYLNPVFEADSHHKYNATSYIHIDEQFGAGNDYRATEKKEDLLDPSTWTWNESDRLFLEFLREAKARGFRVIIDGVFNHVGIKHPAFQDVIENGADSRFAEWFNVTSWDPLEYDCWGGYRSLPVFRKNDEHGIASKEVRDHIMAITTRWMDPDGDGDPSDGIDGWRLDVPNEVPLPFWIEWRTHVKSINPDAYISGEIWDRADQWLDGRSFDAVMNYPFAEATLEWIGNREKKITPTEADRRLAELRMAYPDAATQVMQNLLDSHDTDRLVSKIHNPDRPFDEGNREQQDDTYDGSKPNEDDYRRARLSAFVQMTYLGSPMIYYGDEVGVWGSDDPNNRKPFPWDDQSPYQDDGFMIMPAHLDFYKRAIALRNDHISLRRGEFQTLQVHDDNDTWAFTRTHGDDRVLIAMNASEKDAEIDLPELDGNWILVFSEPANSNLSGPPKITLPPLGAAVWRHQP